MFRIVGILAVHTLIGFSVSAAEARTPIGLLAPASEFVRDRPQAAGTQWVLDYVKDDGSKVRFVLGSDVAGVVSSDVEKAYDFAHKRVLFIDRAAAKFTHASLYLLPAFRHYELRNRVQMNAAVAKAGIPMPESTELFWAETELAMSLKPGSLSGAAMVEEGPNGFRVDYKGSTVFRFIADERSAPVPLVRAYYRLLRHERSIHPVVVEAMERSGRIAKRLELTNYEALKRTQTTFELAAAPREETFAYPLPANFTPAPESMSERRFGGIEKGFLDAMIAVLHAAYRPIEAGRPSDLAGYVAAIKAARSAGRIYDAMFLLMEADAAFRPTCAQGSGSGAACEFESLSTALGPEILNDPIVRRPMSGIMIESKDRAGAILIWEREASRDSPYAYRLDNMLANAYGTMARQAMQGGAVETIRALQAKAEHYFFAAFKGNPRLRYTYDDFADHLFRSFRPFEAWMLWDAGRNIAGIGMMPPRIEQFERSLESALPHLF